MDHELEVPGSFNKPGLNLCNEPDQEKYRPPADIADEIKAIHILNQTSGVDIDEYGFEPANEPNAEWYGFGPDRPRYAQPAWEEMNNYFQAVANRIQFFNSVENLDIKLFTPPMSQDAYAEGINWEL